MKLNIKIKLFDNEYKPIKQHASDACFDCFACLPEGTVKLPPHERMIIPLGFQLELPKNYEAQIRPRSGLSKRGIDGCFGTIDSGYRGVVAACVVNNSDKDLFINDADRICQMKIEKVPQINFEVVDRLEESDRNGNGFGSTGV